MYLDEELLYAQKFLKPDTGPVQCSCCIYFIAGEGYIGNCRYNPPVYDPRFQEGRWPAVLKESTCGKFYPLEVETNE